MDMSDKERHGKNALKESIRLAKETSQDKRKRLNEEAAKRKKERDDELEDERVRAYNRKESRRLGEKFDD